MPIEPAAPAAVHPSKRAKRRFTSARACGHRLIGGTVHRSASSASPGHFAQARGHEGRALPGLPARTSPSCYAALNSKPKGAKQRHNANDEPG
jgi:hypothetical protein